MLAFDALLGQVGAFIASHVGANDLATRYGDSSFLLLCPQGDEAALERLATSLRERTGREKFDQDGRSFSLGLSIGICSFAARLGEVGAMLNGAERAMSDARRPGGSHVGTYPAGPTTAPAGTFQALGEQIRAALKADNFQLLFSRSSRSGSGNRAVPVLRLAGSDSKLYTAAEIFDRQADDLIGEIDRWVLSRCLLVLADAHASNAACACSSTVDRDRDRCAARGLAPDAGDTAPQRRPAGHRVSLGRCPGAPADLRRSPRRRASSISTSSCPGSRPARWHSNCWNSCP
jgi:GGDEF domain-containing protein